ncbi:hypothetical protein CapIbe_012126 [Capra ibex]
MKEALPKACRVSSFSSSICKAPDFTAAREKYQDQHRGPWGLPNGSSFELVRAALHTLLYFTGSQQGCCPSRGVWSPGHQLYSHAQQPPVCTL